VNIELHNISKKFNKSWLFKNINFVIKSKQTVAITGHNGSGKSTLLQLILGYQPASHGTVKYTLNGSEVADESLFKHTAFVAPYLELPEELTLLEAIEFHFSFKQLQSHKSIEQMIFDAGLKGSEHKYIKYFSSGMKQRLKLLLAFNDTSALLLLDEPTSNLDEKGIAWYQQLLASQHHTRTIIIASNQQYEYTLSDAVLNVTKYC
jgi:ABC-type multidrug transport system ATPase subunit